MVPSLWILSIAYPYITMEPEPGTNEMKWSGVSILSLARLCSIRSFYVCHVRLLIGVCPEDFPSLEAHNASAGLSYALGYLLDIFPCLELMVCAVSVLRFELAPEVNAIYRHRLRWSWTGKYD